MAVDIVELPEFWTSQEHRVTQTNKINAAYEVVLCSRMN